LIQEKNYLFVFTKTKIFYQRIVALNLKNPLKTSAYEHASTEDHEEYYES